MAVLGSMTKQPSDIEDSDMVFDDWLPAGDAVSDVVASARLLRGEDTPALVADNVRIAPGGTCKVRVRGGADGSKWRVQLQMITVAGLVKEGEFDVMVKEV